MMLAFCISFANAQPSSVSDIDTSYKVRKHAKTIHYSKNFLLVTLAPPFKEAA